MMIFQSRAGSNLTNKYNPQEQIPFDMPTKVSSNLTNKYNPQELLCACTVLGDCSNLTNKYNPQEPVTVCTLHINVQILPINTTLKNTEHE